jgi:hypothetical protein
MKLMMISGVFPRPRLVRALFLAAFIQGHALIGAVIVTCRNRRPGITSRVVGFRMLAVWRSTPLRSCWRLHGACADNE